MRMKALSTLAIVAVGLSLPTNFEVDVCSKGTILDVSKGKMVCVGSVVKKGRKVNLDQLISDCYEQNPKWTGVVAFHVDRLECY